MLKDTWRFLPAEESDVASFDGIAQRLTNQSLIPIVLVSRCRNIFIVKQPPLETKLHTTPKPGRGESQTDRARYLEVLHKFTISQAELTTLDDIVWNIAKTAIAELGFEDCVVYLLKDDDETLIQIAAHGIKNPDARDILNPIEIKVGDGIVGTTARTGEVQLVKDTRNDPRYILDDEFRLSELAVPITHKGRVIGVLDSEHHQAGFFTPEHIALFTTIAALASTRIDAALAMQRLESAVKQLESAEVKLHLRADELRRAKLDAEAASQAKSDFLASMSHEIRTPMAAIIGFAELLSGHDVDAQDQVVWKNLLVRNAGFLQDLIGNILDVSAVEAGAVSAEFGSCDFVRLARDVVEIMRARADAKNVSLSLIIESEIPNVIVTDRLKLEEIIVNLVSNAVKYTEQGEIRVLIAAERCATPDIAQISIGVADSGIGMSQDAQAELFVPFSRVHDKRRLATIQGTGLGLVLVKRFVELLGGEINVESRVGIGSTFSVILRPNLPPNVAWSTPSIAALTAEHFQPTSTPTEQASLQGLSILCCEDSTAIAMIITSLLESAGADVTACENGQLGVQRAQQMSNDGKPPDLILMDMQMPIMDGYEASRRLKALGLPGPTIALTAFATTDDEAKCLAAGCHYYIHKPIDPKQFTHQVKALLDDFRQRV